MKLNNRGYMLVEIILASALAFGMAYFMISMTIKLKDTNDDLLVETLTTTDQTIIMNSIMKELKGSSCSEVTSQLQIDNKKVLINGNVVDIVNDYVVINSLNCTENNNIVSLNIPISVRQINDKNFDVELYWIRG